LFHEAKEEEEEVVVVGGDGIFGVSCVCGDASFSVFSDY
jgi:hypothetical protein